MPKITFFEPSGNPREVEVGVDMSVMEAAVTNLVEGITADCGGACSCATCHIILDPIWYAKIGGPSEEESELLEFAEGREETSRLGCQITVSEEIDGLIVRVPEL